MVDFDFITKEFIVVSRLPKTAILRWLPTLFNKIEKYIV